MKHMSNLLQIFQQIRIYTLYDIIGLNKQDMTGQISKGKRTICPLLNTANSH